MGMHYRTALMYAQSYAKRFHQGRKAAKKRGLKPIDDGTSLYISESVKDLQECHVIEMLKEQTLIDPFKQWKVTTAEYEELLRGCRMPFDKVFLEITDTENYGPDDDIFHTQSIQMSYEELCQRMLSHDPEHVFTWYNDLFFKNFVAEPDDQILLIGNFGDNIPKLMFNHNLIFNLDQPSVPSVLGRMDEEEYLLASNTFDFEKFADDPTTCLSMVLLDLIRPYVITDELFTRYSPEEEHKPMYQFHPNIAIISIAGTFVSGAANVISHAWDEVYKTALIYPEKKFNEETIKEFDEEFQKAYMHLSRFAYLIESAEKLYKQYPKGADYIRDSAPSSSLIKTFNLTSAEVRWMNKTIENFVNLVHRKAKTGDLLTKVAKIFGMEGLPKSSEYDLFCYAAHSTRQQHIVKSVAFQSLMRVQNFLLGYRYRAAEVVTAKQRLGSGKNKKIGVGRFKHSKLIIHKMKKEFLNVTRQFELEKPRAKSREHDRRGHWRHYKSGKEVWVSKCTVNKGGGSVKKTYQSEI